MKKNFLFLSLCFLIFFISCSRYGEAKKRYDNLPTTIECVKNPELLKKTISELDEIIGLAPDWWEPYHRKIGLISGFEDEKIDYDTDMEIVKVYESWAVIKDLDIQKNVAYASHLEKIGEKEKSKNAIQKAWNDFNKMKKEKPKDWREEIYMFAGIYAGVALGQITKENISEYYYVAGRSPDMITALSDMVDHNPDAVFIWD